MTDILYYRFPGKSVVRKTGNFRLLESTENCTGFIVSDFLKKEIYCFEESEDPAKFHFKLNQPYIPSKKEYLIGAESILNSFHLFGIEKAVYSRVKAVNFDETKTEDLFDQLCSKYPNAFVYLMSAKFFGTWIGATPEILLSSYRDQIFTMSLAGTKKVEVHSNDFTSKEAEEQAIVTDYIENKIRVMGAEDLEIGASYNYQAGPVEHIRTDFSFRMKNVQLLDVAKELHPTPAVAGLPTKEAVDLITALEHNPRKLYAGFLGIIEEDKAQLYVNLRCCEIQKAKAYLYVGGGLTKQSIPIDEWEETENKSRTLHSVIKAIME